MPGAEALGATARSPRSRGGESGISYLPSESGDAILEAGSMRKSYLSDEADQSRDLALPEDQGRRVKSREENGSAGFYRGVSAAPTSHKLGSGHRARDREVKLSARDAVSPMGSSSHKK